jgi:hypothetical protein
MDQDSSRRSLQLRPVGIERAHVGNVKPPAENSDMTKKRAKKIADDFVPPYSILWSELGPKDYKARQLFMKLNSGFTHTVRFFHLPFKFWRLIFQDRSQL